MQASFARRAALMAAASLLGVSSAAVHSQAGNWPTKPIRLKDVSPVSHYETSTPRNVAEILKKDIALWQKYLRDDKVEPQ
jgi:hypothetical protein